MVTLSTTVSSAALALARNESQGSVVEFGVKPVSRGCEAADAGLKKAARAKLKIRKKPLGTRRRKQFSEMLRAAMLAQYQWTVGECAKGASCNATADRFHGIVARPHSDIGSAADTQTVAQILTELAGCVHNGAEYHVEAELSANLATTTRAIEQSPDDDIYYPMYGKYYSTKQVTVTTDYATTTRFGSTTAVILLVVQSTVFSGSADLVGHLKAPDKETFKDFCPKDEFGKRPIGTDPRGLCFFYALKGAT
ncbi:hypothetical protein PHYSODRAFT_335794 [Phytophthora sojae]|uniref:Uncharacterized protein n=1 Tax=Phytophthora sojae (strain P6497) TaxID=1094619 RepID=G4ZRG8_PHYSP|nr:hypothetical protein PHYSODRAFT_335794 [Phytophthora sojae]EGZ14121.1 hypothetical protein PHYSODRAFT_335794 [Phytophthora sojae]|eukprot:XP_009531550.1 hypothetical protein PHYSODRAFT_335794 [Phytophthora sojae]